MACYECMNQCIIFLYDEFIKRYDANIFIFTENASDQDVTNVKKLYSPTVVQVIDENKISAVNSIISKKYHMQLLDMLVFERI